MTEKEAKELLNGTKEEKVEALIYFANRKKSTKAMMELANYYYSINNIDEAISYFTLASYYKDPTGYNSLGSMYLYGKKVEKDYAMAFKYFTKSYLLGNDYAKLKLADMYLNGYYVKKDYKYAIAYLEPLYDKYYNKYIKGEFKDNLFMEVLLRYSKCYEEGFGFKKDLDEALKCMIVARDGFKEILDIPGSKALYDFTLSEIERLKNTHEYNKFEILEHVLDVYNTFSYEYYEEEDYVSFTFNFDSPLILVSLNKLESKVTTSVTVCFKGIVSFNAMDMEVMRPIDFQNRGDLFRLYDSEQTLLHFKFKEYNE